jgi:hypothetical protein
LQLYQTFSVFFAASALTVVIEVASAVRARVIFFLVFVVRIRVVLFFLVVSFFDLVSLFLFAGRTDTENVKLCFTLATKFNFAKVFFLVFTEMTVALFASLFRLATCFITASGVLFLDLMKLGPTRLEIRT